MDTSAWKKIEKPRLVYTSNHLFCFGELMTTEDLIIGKHPKTKVISAVKK